MDYLTYAVILICFWVLFYFRKRGKQRSQFNKVDNFGSKFSNHFDIFRKKLTAKQRRDQPHDQFPVGIRVLAVDDDPICLGVLDTLFRKCLCHVTTRSQAITALNMLRENKNKFDLVICNVHMPDMDESKLLELVGLKPVIMMSANSDMKILIKGSRHGACEYLRKPVRWEELQNICQRVIKRKLVVPRDRKSSNRLDKDSVQGKGQDEHDFKNKDPSAQIEPRLIWSVKLHQKFVDAVNQLGLEKAVPEKILELMHVEKLTRENVATHLEKYRQYLEKFTPARQNANLIAVAGLGGPGYSPMHAVNLHNLNASTLIQNTSTGLVLHGPSPSRMDHGRRPLGKGQDENYSENEDSSAQKNPPFFWSVELHQKFVAAVNQLGHDDAVPEKILKLMNVEKLTTEKVATHLEKYRQYWKKFTPAHPYANLVEVAGLSGPGYSPMHSVNLHNLNAFAQIQNTSTGLGLHGPSLSGDHGRRPMGKGQDENYSENEDSSAQKNPPLFWSLELHRKFVAAVNQLGLDEAVPEKILELMNVEKLTRETVASHLEIKKIFSPAHQNANLVAVAVAGYSPMHAVNLHNLNVSAQIPNTSSGLGLHRPSPSIMNYGSSPMGNYRVNDVGSGSSEDAVTAMFNRV